MTGISNRQSSLSGISSVLLTAAIIIIGLVYGQSFLIPVVIALLIATLIGAGADRLERLGLPSWLAMFTAVFIIAAAIFGISDILASQTDAVIQAWPRYVVRLETLTDQALVWVGPNVSAKINQALAKLDLTQLIPGIVGSAGELIVSIMLITLYAGFLLTERGKFSAKIARLSASTQKAAQMRRAVTDISESIRSYIWIKTIMSLLTAAIGYAVLKMLGIDFAETWALLIFLLNYIPSIGSALAVVFPALLALLQFDTTWQFLIIAILLSSVQVVIGNIIEPAFMGRTLNLSPFIVIASLAFWGTIWGVVGAFLSVPMTTALVIACSHVPSYRWIAILLSDDGRILGQTTKAEMHNKA